MCQRQTFDILAFGFRSCSGIIPPPGWIPNGAFPNLSRNVPKCPCLSLFVPTSPRSGPQEGRKRTKGDKTGDFGTNWETPPFRIHPHLALLEKSAHTPPTCMIFTFHVREICPDVYEKIAHVSESGFAGQLPVLCFPLESCFLHP